MQMLVQARAKAVDKSHCANLQGNLVHLRGTGAVRLSALRNNPQKNTQHHVQYRPITLHEVAQALGDGKHPLAHRQARKDVIGQMRRRLHHAACVARGADTLAFAGEGHKVVVRAVSAAGVQLAEKA